MAKRRKRRTTKVNYKYPRKRNRYNSSRNYNDPIYKEWRKAVFKRDGHCCQWHGCKKKKGLNAHHILKWASYPSLRFEVPNGITLCKYHHDSIQSKEDAFAPMFMRILSDRLGKKKND